MNNSYRNYSTKKISPFLRDNIGIGIRSSYFVVIYINSEITILRPQPFFNNQRFEKYYESNMTKLISFYRFNKGHIKYTSHRLQSEILYLDLNVLKIIIIDYNNYKKYDKYFNYFDESIYKIIFCINPDDIIIYSKDLYSNLKQGQIISFVEINEEIYNIKF